MNAFSEGFTEGAEKASKMSPKKQAVLGYVTMALVFAAGILLGRRTKRS